MQLLYEHRPDFEPDVACCFVPILQWMGPITRDLWTDEEHSGFRKLVFLTRMMPIIKDENKDNKYRPILITSVILRLLSGVLNDVAQEEAELIISGNQYGFIRHRRTAIGDKVMTWMKE